MKYLNTRDLDKRLTELEDMFESQEEAQEEMLEALKLQDNEQTPEAMEAFEKAEDALTDATLTEEETEELKELQELRDEISEWSHGETLIPECEFEDYARELAEDIGAIDRYATWPLGCIDWKEAAEELQSDYSSCEYQGETYYYRS
jgi:hypothetical protein